MFLPKNNMSRNGHPHSNDLCFARKKGWTTKFGRKCHHDSTYESPTESSRWVEVLETVRCVRDHIKSWFRITRTEAKQGKLINMLLHSTTITLTQIDQAVFPVLKTDEVSGWRSWSNKTGKFFHTKNTRFWRFISFNTFDWQRQVTKLIDPNSRDTNRFLADADSQDISSQLVGQNV